MKTVEAVRKRPGMYVGNLSDNAVIGLIKNLITSVILQFEADDIIVELFEPFKLQLKFKGIKKEVDKSYSFEFQNNIGGIWMDVPILNFLSERFQFKLVDEAKVILHQEFSKGELITEESNAEKLSCQEMIIIAKLDNEIWNNKLEWNPYHFNIQLGEFGYLNKQTKITLKYQIEKENCKVIFFHKNGLQDWLNILKLDGYGNTYFETYLEQKIGNLYFEIAFAFRELSIDQAIIKSFVNDHYTHEKGSHVDGLLKGVTLGVMKYFQKHNLVNDYKISEKGMEQSLIALINVKLEEAKFSGCVKNKLANPGIIDIIANEVTEILFNKIQKDQQSTNRLIQRFKI